MEGYLGEIRWFAGNFAPKDWAFCAGQQLSVQQFKTLFDIIKTKYGGDGDRTFNLPDMRGRAAVGVGQGNGLSPYELGKSGGAADVLLEGKHLPAHNHTANVTPGTVTASATLNALTGGTATANVAGAFIQGDSAIPMFAADTTTGLSAMDASAIILSNIAGPAQLPTVTIAAAGTQTPAPHSNLQPYLGMNFIICLSGSSPERP
jgi:microcystin-dependent protein